LITCLSGKVCAGRFFNFFGKGNNNEAAGARAAEDNINYDIIDHHLATAATVTTISN
jgi:hypothetical protein